MTKSLPVPHAGSHDAHEPANDVSTEASADSERFVEERLLGQGTMGVVHLVRDRETGEQLARKQLLRVDAKGVLRLKREFRSLADVSHPNLVKLYELGRERDVWFLTMEYVPGVDLKAYLGLTPANRSDDAATKTLSASGEDEPVAREQRIAPQTLQLRAAPQLSKVLAAFHQLALGIDALHRARVLHRDLKPSNVLVADERVIVLDFGLARRLDEGALTVTEEGMVAGTPAYMAPEQVRGLALTEASDWYAFGCMLYEALTAELPHDGSLYEILEGKLEGDPVPPIAINPALPANLSALCMSLLSRSPEARPSGAEVLAQLEPARPELPGSAQELQTSLLEPQTVLQTGPAPLYGRERQLAALRAAKQRSEAGHTTVMHVRGVSGSGKSTLVETFLDQIESSESPHTLQPTLVLRSRCYEREAMPFKALDGVMDVLSRHFLRFDDIEVSHRLPSDIVALAKLFPVLERVRVVERLARDRNAHGDAVSARQRAELALHDLFARLSAHSPLVIWIDDLQWGDLDSAGVLKSWLQRTTALPILVLLSYRADEVDTSECLRFMLGTDAAVEVVDVPPLAAEDVAAICRDRLAGPDDREALIARMVKESHGSPFLAAQLAALAPLS